MEDDGGFDVYGDLEEFDYKIQYEKVETANKVLQRQLDDASKKVKVLEEEMIELQRRSMLLERSFQSLLQTARSEINRKDALIASARKERDDIIFRRKRHSELTNHQENSLQKSKYDSIDNKHIGVYQSKGSYDMKGDGNFKGAVVVRAEYGEDTFTRNLIKMTDDHEKSPKIIEMVENTKMKQSIGYKDKDENKDRSHIRKSNNYRSDSRSRNSKDERYKSNTRDDARYRTPSDATEINHEYHNRYNVNKYRHRERKSDQTNRGGKYDRKNSSAKVSYGRCDRNWDYNKHDDRGDGKDNSGNDRSSRDNDRSLKCAHHVSQPKYEDRRVHKLEQTQSDLNYSYNRSSYLRRDQKKSTGKYKNLVDQTFDERRSDVSPGNNCLLKVLKRGPKNDRSESLAKRVKYNDDAPNKNLEKVQITLKNNMSNHLDINAHSEDDLNVLKRQLQMELFGELSSDKKFPSKQLSAVSSERDCNKKMTTTRQKTTKEPELMKIPKSKNWSRCIASEISLPQLKNNPLEENPVRLEGNEINEKYDERAKSERIDKSNTEQSKNISNKKKIAGSSNLENKLIEKSDDGKKFEECDVRKASTETGHIFENNNVVVFNEQHRIKGGNDKENNRKVIDANTQCENITGSKCIIATDQVKFQIEQDKNIKSEDKPRKLPTKPLESKSILSLDTCIEKSSDNFNEITFTSIKSVNSNAEISGAKNENQLNDGLNTSALLSYETYLANHMSPVLIRPDGDDLCIKSESETKTIKKSKKTSKSPSIRLVGHRIEGFERDFSPRKSHLDTSRELKHELFKEALGNKNGPLNETINNSGIFSNSERKSLCTKNSSPVETINNSSFFSSSTTTSFTAQTINDVKSDHNNMSILAKSNIDLPDKYDSLKPKISYQKLCCIESNADNLISGKLGRNPESSKIYSTTKRRNTTQIDERRKVEKSLIRGKTETARYGNAINDKQKDNIEIYKYFTAFSNREEVCETNKTAFVFQNVACNFLNKETSTKYDKADNNKIDDKSISIERRNTVQPNDRSVGLIHCLNKKNADPRATKNVDAEHIQTDSEIGGGGDDENNFRREYEQSEYQNRVNGQMLGNDRGFLGVVPQFSQSEPLERLLKDQKVNNMETSLQENRVACHHKINETFEDTNVSANMPNELSTQVGSTILMNIQSMAQGSPHISTFQSDNEAELLSSVDNSHNTLLMAAAPVDALNESDYEKRNISTASTNYVIEKVNQNVINVFITRKKVKRKKRN